MAEELQTGNEDILCVNDFVFNYKIENLYSYYLILSVTLKGRQGFFKHCVTKFCRYAKL